MSEYPRDLSPALSEVLGMPPGHVMWWVRGLRNTGAMIKQHYEEENAAVRHFLIQFVLTHGDSWFEVAVDSINDAIVLRNISRAIELMAWEATDD